MSSKQRAASGMCKALDKIFPAEFYLYKTLTYSKSGCQPHSFLATSFCVIPWRKGHVLTVIWVLLKSCPHEISAQPGSPDQPMNMDECQNTSYGHLYVREHPNGNGWWLRPNKPWSPLRSCLDSTACLGQAQSCRGSQVRAKYQVSHLFGKPKLNPEGSLRGVSIKERSQSHPAWRRRAREVISWTERLTKTGRVRQLKFPSVWAWSKSRGEWLDWWNLQSAMREQSRLPGLI